MTGPLGLLQAPAPNLAEDQTLIAPAVLGPRAHNPRTGAQTGTWPNTTLAAFHPACGVIRPRSAPNHPRAERATVLLHAPGVLHPSMTNLAAFHPASSLRRQHHAAIRPIQFQASRQHRAQCMCHNRHICHNCHQCVGRLGPLGRLQAPVRLPGRRPMIFLALFQSDSVSAPARSLARGPNPGAKFGARPQQEGRVQCCVAPWHLGALTPVLASRAPRPWHLARLGYLAWRLGYLGYLDASTGQTRTLHLAILLALAILLG
jgi:hypothetical protein